LIKYEIPALTRHRLTWVRQNYIRAETLVQANVKLVNYQTTIPMAKNGVVVR
jgi:TnpA family transposase